MNHNYVRDDNFNILTVRRVKGHLIFTGETKEPLEVGDVINYPFGGFQQVCLVDKIMERRDSKSYPKGNGYYYSCECSPIQSDDKNLLVKGFVPIEETEK